MGQVAVTLKVMPTSAEVNLDKIKKQIEAALEEYHDAKLQQIYDKPIGFGLTALQVLIVLPDTAGGTESIEAAIASIEGVSSVESEGVTLI